MKRYLVGLAVMALSGFCLSQSQRVGAWSYGDLDNGLGMYAATYNASGGFLVQQCYFEDESCYWMMGTDATCEAQESYPALINGNEGASTVELYCFKIGAQFRTAFKDFAAMNVRVGKGGILGVAVPMANGEFRVNRFDMNGGSAAVAAMNKRFTSRARKSTKSQTL